MHQGTISRRGFLSHTALGVAGLTAASWSRVLGANERLRVAAVGVGGKGWSDLTSVAASPQVDVVAICDIDESDKHLGRAAAQYPKAARFTDWRKVLDLPRTFDGLIVATPDHMHAPVAMPAMQLGKHVHCQKPLTHTVHEARQMRLAADKYRVVTQMGNQIQSHEAYRTAVKLVHDGVIGKVKRVHSWQSGDLRWLIESDRPAGADPVPPGVHWDSWLGAAPVRPYKKTIYHPFNWRAWQDFSNGQIGDFGCHILDPVFMALELTTPINVKASAPPMNREVWTKQSTVHYAFQGTARTTLRTLPLTWYDGEGHLPPREAIAGVPASATLPRSGSALIGEKGTMVIPHVALPQVYLADGSVLKYEKVPAVNHYTSWADACRGVGRTTSHFGYAGPLTEAVLLGAVAIRVPDVSLEWDAKELKIRNSEKANALLRKTYRKGWEPTWIG